MAATGEGTAFGKYFLLKKIAAGGMGEIYLAKLKGPVGFEKLLVIKRILQHHVENEEFLDMFFAEARVAAQLNHNNVVQIYEMGEIDDAFFIAMEYVHGQSLHEVIARARQMGEYIPPGLVVEIIAQLCAGLSFAHNARNMSGESLGLIHRDINPHNMIVAYGGAVKVIDFGIAKSEMSMHKTETGTIKGKFVYMSPEQSAAEELDKRSDIFACGICLYEALTFVNPFAKANVVLSLDAIQRKDPPSLTETNHRLAPFDRIVQKACAKKREDRYQDCMEMHDDLIALLRGGEIPRHPQPLADYMHELFEQHIEDEKRMIIATDSANTEQIEQMRSARVRESQQSRVKAHRTGSARVATHSGHIELIEEESHSRLPFFLVLFGILAISAIAFVAVTRLGGPSSDKPNVVTPLAKTTPTGTNTEVGSATKVGTDSNEPAGTGEPVKANVVVAKATEPPKTQEQPTTKTQSPSSKSTNKSTNNKSIKTKTENKTRTEPKPKSTKTTKTSSSQKTTSTKPKVVTPPEPPPPPQKVEPKTFGSVVVSTSPPVRISLRGKSGQTFKLKDSKGLLAFGSGGDPQRDPFKVKILYSVSGGKISFTSIAATPWAIVRGKGGIGLGKTPLSNVKGSTSNVFELLNPKESRKIRITIRYSP